MWTLKEAFVKSTGAGSSMRFDRLDTSFDPLRVVVDGRDFDADVWSWCHQEEWTFDQQPYWLAVTARPARTTHLLLTDDTDPRHHGTPVA
jgi:phosphopantetheinyl transferase